MPSRLAVKVCPVVLAVGCIALVAGCTSKDNSERRTGTSVAGKVCFGNGTSEPNPCPVSTTVVSAKRLTSGTVDSALDVAAGIKSGGIGCNEASLDTAGVSPPPDSLTKEGVSCDVGDDAVAITLFTNHDALDASLRKTHGNICAAASEGHVNLTYVEGDNWIAFPGRKATAEKVAGAVDGTLRTIDC